MNWSYFEDLSNFLINFMSTTKFVRWFDVDIENIDYFVFQ